jgi:hypothetical protein
MKKPIPEDFAPDQGKIDLLNAWGAVNPPKGDMKCGEWFTTRVDIIAEFIDYWKNRAKDNKKKDWQATYCNYVKRIAWPNELRDFEQNRHYRIDSGGSGDFFTNALSNEPKPKVVPERKYKLPVEREPVEPMSMVEAFKQLNGAIK